MAEILSWPIPDFLAKSFWLNPLRRLNCSENVGEWSKDTSVVVLVEGEKAADALLEAGFCALGTVTGAGGTPEAEALQVLEGFEVVLWPDNDDQGRAHMERVAAALRAFA